VAAFNLEADLSGDLAWRLMANAYVSMFWQTAVLTKWTTWLLEHEYDVVALDAGPWATEADMHREIAQALNFPDYYGRNLDAFNDCLSDVAAGSYGWNPEAAGLALVLTRFDTFAKGLPRAASIVLDIFANQARTASLIGNRMLCLVQSDDPNLRMEPVGATPVMWNPDESLDSKRHPEG
jgi:hypothetical protein